MGAAAKQNDLIPPLKQTFCYGAANHPRSTRNDHTHLTPLLLLFNSRLYGSFRGQGYTPHTVIPKEPNSLNGPIIGLKH